MYKLRQNEKFSLKLFVKYASYNDSLPSDVGIKSKVYLV